MDEAAATTAVAAAGIVVLPSVYSDSDPAVRDVIKEQALALPGRNPREVKRLVNVFRFYTLLANEMGILAGSTPAELDETFDKVARLSYLAIHWPFFLSLFGNPVIDGDVLGGDEEPSIALDLLEQSAGAGTNTWLTALEKVGLVRRPRPEEDPIPLQSWKKALDDLQRFLKGQPKIAALARDLL